MSVFVIVNANMYKSECIRDGYHDGYCLPFCIRNIFLAGFCGQLSPKSHFFGFSFNKFRELLQSVVSCHHYVPFSFLFGQYLLTNMCKIERRFNEARAIVLKDNIYKEII